MDIKKMDIKDFSFNAIKFGVIFFITSTAIQYFLFDKSKLSQVKATVTEPTFFAPKTNQKNKPLNIEIDFIDSKQPKKPIISEIQTVWGNVTFSTNGASLETIDFKHDSDQLKRSIRTIFPVSDTERESRCFLVALQENTPYYYDLIERKDGQDGSVSLTYQAQFDKGIIRKTFVIYNKKHTIDCIIEVVPERENSKPIELRLFYPSPVMPAIVQSDLVSSIVADRFDTFQKTVRSKLDMQKGWFSPTLFGTDNRFFIHALVRDDNSFVQRAYYKFAEKEKMFSIVEGPEVTSAQKWNLSFYFGPKESESIFEVDERLEKTLDYYGWFGPVAKLLLCILKWLFKHCHNYGLAIIILTSLTTLVLFPLTMRSEQKMKQQKEMQKKLVYIQQKYKHDADRLNMEKIELIKKHGMPGLGGYFLPMVLRMPIFFSLSRVLSTSVELYQAPFLWIADLSVKDPYYILPFLVGTTMFLQALSQKDPQQRTTGLMIALVFGVFSAYFSSGLVLYFCVSTGLGVLQTKFMHHVKFIK